MKDDETAIQATELAFAIANANDKSNGTFETSIGPNDEVVSVDTGYKADEH